MTLIENDNHDYLTYSISNFSRIFVPKSTFFVSKMCGSRRFEFIDSTGYIDLKTKKPKKTKEPKEKKPKSLKNFRINKKEVTQRINALSALKISKNNLFFGTISFPINFPDTSAIKVLNSWLTTVRLKTDYFNYVWVSERQKNGTLHYHIIFNKFLNVRLYNYIIAKAIDVEIKNNNLSWSNSSKEKYNGLDIRKIFNLKSITAYVTKYVSKSNDIFNSRAWGMDHTTANLFISSIAPFDSQIDNNNRDNILKKTISKIYTCEHGLLMFFRSKNNLSYFNFMLKLNDLIHNYLSFSVVSDLLFKPKIIEDCFELPEEFKCTNFVLF